MKKYKIIFHDMFGYSKRTKVSSLSVVFFCFNLLNVQEGVNYVLYLVLLFSINNMFCDVR